MRKAVALLICSLALSASAASAQSQPAPPNLRGFAFGLDPVTYGQLSSDGITGGRTVGGGGLSLRFGWGFTERLALVMDVGVTDLPVADTAIYFLGHGDVLLRWTPMVRETRLGFLVPFLHAGIGLRDIDATDASPTGTAIYIFEGEVFTIGGGTSLYISPKFAFFVAGYWSTGDFNDLRVGNTTTHNQGVAGVSSRVSIGMTLHRGRAAAPLSR